MRTIEDLARLYPACRDEERRADLLAHPVLNGIDFVEYEHRPADPNPHVLVVRFLKDLPDAPHSDPDGAYGLTEHPELVTIEGGTRTVGLEALEVRLVGEAVEIDVDRGGDFSIYWLALGFERQSDGSWQQTIPGLDPLFSVAPVSFKAGCPVDFDCRPEEVCPPEEVAEPLIDYLAKDYASFRRLLLDLVPQRNPDWLERNPADLGIALVELLAYEGDHLSYFQDAVANEAYLDTARQRVSARRHARLVDYRVHDGRNAWTFVHVEAGSPGVIPQGTAAFLTRLPGPLQGHTGQPPVELAAADLDFDTDPALARARVFETAFALEVHRENNAILLHAWGNRECCLPRGTLRADLFAPNPNDAGQAIRPQLAAGDYLLLEEVAGPATGAAADADPEHRQVVRLEEVLETEDPAYSDQLEDGRPLPFEEDDDPLPLVRVTWRRQDALRFPLCLSARRPGAAAQLNLSVARGNMVLADHGRTVVEELPLGAPVPPGPAPRLTLDRGPLTQQCQGDDATYDGEDRLLVSDRHELDCDPREARPAVALRVDYPSGSELWTPVPDLLDSPPAAAHFVAEVDNRGRARLRFGDGEYGRRPTGAVAFTALYRVGNGRPGNVGAEALAHVVRPDVAPGWPAVVAVRNPLPAAGGADRETLEEVRQLAPAAFHAEQFRAVTESDYADAARKLPEVAGAVATFRWTGSWYTVYVGVDPLDPADLVTLPGGRTRLVPELEQRVRVFLTRYKLAGYDMEIRSGDHVPLEIEVELCVEPGHFRGDVAQAVLRALSNRVNADGSRGFFHPDHFTFGQPVYLSRLYAAVEAVEGVDSLVVRRFHRFGDNPDGELEAARISIGPWEIARLDNDPNFMENGVLRLEVGGGK